MREYRRTHPHTRAHTRVPNTHVGGNPAASAEVLRSFASMISRPFHRPFSRAVLLHRVSLRCSCVFRDPENLRASAPLAREKRKNGAKKVLSHFSPLPSFSIVRRTIARAISTPIYRRMDHRSDPSLPTRGRQAEQVVSGRALSLYFFKLREHAGTLRGG